MVVIIDDILVYSRTREDYEEHLQIVLETLRAHQLYAKLEECDVWQEKVKFLSHVVTREGVAMDPSKVDAVYQWGQPANATEIHSFLSLVGYYRRFIEGFSRIAAPLTWLTWKGAKFVWSDACHVIGDELPTFQAVVQKAQIYETEWVDTQSDRDQRRDQKRWATSGNSQQQQRRWPQRHRNYPAV
ncbi:uncharacterized mitochondrial protein AtMg00860-like [Magnolia sinica]|uniref:uncharacterized mitochondrial protein AtMg00860-like n=1 Tax=Magnolia sinica TaxID=86752 RepID=UPI002659195E|nr:uncharacterized mitochondrial protein AtMg00860-like [Magnolia sinica]